MFDGDTSTQLINLTKDLKDTCLSFDGFFGGTLIVYGNNQFFIDDLSNPSIFDETPTDYDVTQTLRYLQTKIIKPETPSTTSNMIHIQSRGINAKYSALAFRNNYAECYLYNLKIENTMMYNDEVIYNDYDFPEYDNVIIYWPLINDCTPQIINQSYLNKRLQYTLNKQSVIFSDSTVNGADIKTAEMNTNAVHDNADIDSEIPGYMWLDNKNNDIKTQSNDIKNIIYNTNRR